MVFAVISGTSPSASLANSSSVAVEKRPEENSDGWGSAWLLSLVESTHGPGVARAKARARVQVRGVVLSQHFLGRACTSRNRKDKRQDCEQNTFSPLNR